MRVLTCGTTLPIAHLIALTRLFASWLGTKRAETLATAAQGITEKRVGPNLSMQEAERVRQMQDVGEEAREP